MMSRSLAPIATIVVALLLPAACRESVPPRFGDPELAERVKAEFLHAWNGYVQHAWGHDDLKPLSGDYKDWHDASLYMTPVDAFDTMLLLGLDVEAERAKRLVLENLTFDHDITVQVFEITIRTLGALITAYQLDGDERFLALATDLADRLLPAFDSPTGMPYWGVNLRTGATRGAVMNPAEIGTLTLEFGTLSRLTGNPVYYDAVKAGVLALYERRSDIGLVGTTINVETGEWENRDSHISGMIDSYYEYLLKAWLLFGDRDFYDMWATSSAAANAHLPDQRENGLWYSHVQMETGERTATRFGALDCFLPATLALGGDLEPADRLMDSCFLMWTTFGIEPEQLDYVTMEPVYRAYHLRPEAVESAYYLYRLTGRAKYLEMGRAMFEAIVEYCRTDNGYAMLTDVTTKEKGDSMESFFLAETLKYAYLLFAPPETLDFEAVIFNTEAHPIWRTWE